MADLKTNYVDDKLNASTNQLRKYKQIKNDDGTVSFVDVTDYTATGTSFGASDINATNTAVNKNTTDISSLNLKLGKVYNNTTVITKNIPATKKTTFIRFNNIDFGTYIVFANVSLTTTQPAGGALLSLDINNSAFAFVEEVPNIDFLGSATVCGYAVISKTTDSISASYYSINSVTISSAELVAIRIS